MIQVANRQSQYQYYGYLWSYATRNYGISCNGTAIDPGVYCYQHQGALLIFSYTRQQDEIIRPYHRLDIESTPRRLELSAHVPQLHSITVTSGERNGDSNHLHIDCLFNWFFTLTTKKTSNLRLTGPLWWESTDYRWILLKKGQWYGKRFIFMASTCFVGISRTQKKEFVP